MIIRFIRRMFGYHSPIQLRNATAPNDWRQTVTEMKDLEMPWLHHSHRQAKSR